MPNKRARKDTTLKVATLKAAPDELEQIRAVAEQEGVSVSYLLRAAGTAIANNEEWRAVALGEQHQRDTLAGGVAIPPAHKDT